MLLSEVRNKREVCKLLSSVVLLIFDFLVEIRNWSKETAAFSQHYALFDNALSIINIHRN